MNRRERLWLAGVGLALLLASNLPYLVAWAATPEDAQFTGLVFNPVDGHSYLAKMRQGFEGSWRFQLPFTPETSPGAHIFLYHLWLGHLARWSGLPLITTYHAARIVGGAFMLVAIYALAASLTDRQQEHGTMFLLTVVSSGLGWLVVMIGLRTADLWVPEAFPFYALMANAHFPLAIGLMTVVAQCGLRVLDLVARGGAGAGPVWPTGLAMALAALLLGAIQPFGLVPVFGGLGIVLAAQTLSGGKDFRGSVPWQAAVWIVGAAAVALPYPLYMQAAIQSDPLLAAWHAQNVTNSPPWWDWVLSYGPILPLTVWGAHAAVRRIQEGGLMTLGWAVVTFVGMYLPLALQRRLSIGLGIPMGILAGWGWCRGAQRRIPVRARSLVRGLIIALSTLTPVFLIVAALLGAVSPQSATIGSWSYLSEGERAALSWLRNRPEAVVLCSPQTGSFIPAWSSQRVVYGHPFETVRAERRREQVEAYWSGEMTSLEQAAFLREHGVRYLFIGPRERAIGGQAGERTRVGDLAFERDDTRIYEVSER